MQIFERIMEEWADRRERKREKNLHRLEQSTGNQRVKKKHEVQITETVNNYLKVSERVSGDGM